MRPISPCRTIWSDEYARPEGSMGVVIYLDSLGNYFFDEEYSYENPLQLGPYPADECD